MSTNSRRVVVVLACSLVVVAGCGLAPRNVDVPANQTVSGALVQGTFPAPVDTARVMRGTSEITRTAVAADGTFQLNIPAGLGYSIEFVRTGGAAGLVFPRLNGTIAIAFEVKKAAAPFDLGKVRYIGDPHGRLFTVRHGLHKDTSAGEQNAGADGDDVQCEDGLDPATGAVCVEDGDAQDEGVCDDGEEGEGEKDEGEGEKEKGDDADKDNVECENGVDPNTGAACADDDSGEDEKAEAGGEGKEHDADDVECENGVDPKTGAACEDGGEGDENGEEGSAASQELPSEAAVADNNLPAMIGDNCQAGEDDGEEDGRGDDEGEGKKAGSGEPDTDDIECEDGIDVKTGAACPDEKDEA
ncbi:MAG: hypothetical protein HY897_05760 [Deltaproteobacteria bacterium]|nr:hypothetical protein [Deltaproteobacteria bacterium]